MFSEGLEELEVVSGAFTFFVGGFGDLVWFRVFGGSGSKGGLGLPRCSGGAPICHPREAGDRQQEKEAATKIEAPPS